MKKCQHCKKQFSRKKNCSLKNWEKQKYCSRACIYKFMASGRHWNHLQRLERDKILKEKNCELCGESFTRRTNERLIYFKRRRFCSRSCHGKYASSKIGIGKDHHLWNGGKSSINEKIRKTQYYAEWRISIFKRDNFICQNCGATGTLNVDHIIPLAELIERLQIKSLKQARLCKQLWDKQNGRTLCEECHKATPTYGRKYFQVVTK